MILFDLVCGRGHRFEGWFRTGAAFGAQAAAGEVSCPVCGDHAVRKALMAPAVATRRGGRDDAAPGDHRHRAEAQPQPEQPEQRPQRQQGGGGVPPPAPADPRPTHAQAANVAQVLRQMRRYIEQNFQHVGPRFAEEARRMHQGETERRSIYGEASAEESRALRDEGIEVAQIPWLPPHDG
ncbi:MAG TPA: DUF1178 family protein [Geminicoccaceae bacterium]|nr:DUF1178 family protein [Geminicoccaceae bacterium]